MKRWKSRFISFVSIVLVFSTLLSTVAYAAGPTIELSGYSFGTVSYGTYELTTYRYYGSHFCRAVCTDSDYSVTDLYSTNSDDYFSYASASYSLSLYLGYCQHSYVASSGKEGILVSTVNSVDNFKQVTVEAPITILSTVDASCTVQLRLQTLDSMGYSMYSYDGTSKSVSLTGGTSKTFTVSTSFSSFQSSSEVAVLPYIYVRFNSPPSSGYVYLESPYFSYIVKTAEDMADYPVFSKNLSTSPVKYLKNDESSALSVQASVSDGGSLSYKWYCNTTGSTSDGSYVGSDTTCYPSTSTAGTYYYYCVVTNTKNDKTSSTTSNVATVQVIDAPKAPQITQNLGTGTMEYVQGADAAALTVSASTSDSGTISYQWYANTVNSSDGGSAISGATRSSYVPPTSSTGTMYYYCIITNTLEGYSESVTSNVTGIRVTASMAPSIILDLSSQEVQYKQNANAAALVFSAISVDGGTVSYQWYRNTTALASGGVAIEGATTSRYVPPTDMVGTIYYYCVATNNAYGYGSSIASTVATITVLEPLKAMAPVITADLSTDEVTYTEGKAAGALRIGAEVTDGGTLSYQWWKSDDGVSSAIPGATLSSFTPDTSELGTIYYFCIVTNTLDDTTASTTSSLAMITVEQDKTPDLLETIIGGIGNIWESIKNIPQALSDIWESIKNIPQALLDGIKDLFVPDAEYIASYKDRWWDLLTAHFGFLFQSFEIMEFVGESLDPNANGISDTISVPSVTVDLAGTPWTFGGWTVDVVPDGFEFLTDASKTIISFLATFSFLNALSKRADRILGGPKH